jgi:heterodisulfide reductase subunit A-like polyferredoxin
LSAFTVAVIGAGIAGLSLANTLAHYDLDVLLVDRSPAPGGRAARYGCKAADSCVHCGVCLLREAQDELRRSRRVRTLFGASPTAFRRGGDGRFELELTSSLPMMIDWRRCSECGRCREACPAGVIEKAAGWSYVVTEGCTECGKCVEACGLNAVVPAESRLVEADCIVVATGFTPYNPAANRRWGYPGGPRILTGSELEELFFRERCFPALTGKAGEDSPQSVAFIQCVGSRHLSDGTDSCSRVCCAYALRLAGRLKHELPETAVDIYVMDIQNFGRHFASLWSGVAPELNFIHTLPVAVSTDGEKRPLVRYEPPEGGACREKTYDLLVLSHGVCPAEDAAATAELFALDVDARGFFGPGAEGIFPVGTCREPMGIEECVEDALRVSAQVRGYLEKGS